MNRKNEQLWAVIKENGIVNGELPEKTGSESPWFVKILMAFSGWLAALFLLFFIGISFEFLWKDTAAAFILGAFMIAGSYLILRIPKNEFFEHMALAVSLAGQALIVFAIFKTSGHNDILAWFLVGLYQIPLALFMPDFIHRVFSSFGAALSFYLCIVLLKWPDIASSLVMLSAVICCLHEFRWPRHIRKIRAIGYGLILALILFKCTSLFDARAISWRFHPQASGIWGGPFETLLTGGVILYLIRHLLYRYNRTIYEPISVFALTGAFFLCILSIKIPWLPIGLVIILLGFAGSNRVLLGLGITSLLFYVSSYYYLLSTTLLYKSISLLIVGLGLLLIRMGMEYILHREKEVPHV